MKFDYEKVNEYIQKLEKALGDIRDEYDDCLRLVNYIKSSDAWEGPAANNFMIKAKRAIDNCKKNEESLNAIIKYIRSCYNNYETTEQSIVKEISSAIN